MNVSSLGNSPAYLSALAGTAPNQAVAGNADPDGDGDGPSRIGGGQYHHRGGGRMSQALTDALQQLGLSMPSSTAAATSASAVSTQGADADGDSDGSGQGAGGVRQDMHSFMHAMFDAIRSEGSGVGASTNNGVDASGLSGSVGSTNAPKDPRAGFATRFAELVSQVSSGNAPPDLQASFDKLMSDLQGNSTGGTSSTGTPILTTLLTTMQQQLGYAGSTASNAVGNGLNATA